MHILIAGSDEVAFSIAEGLMAKHQVVLIGPEAASVPRLDRLDVELVTGAPTSTEVLRGARVRRCGIFIAATRSDEQNLVACITARRLGAKRTVCILSRPGFIESGERDSELAVSLGLDAVVRPSVQLAREIVRIVTVPGALDVEHFVGGRVHLLRHVVEEHAPVVGRRLADVKLPKTVVALMCRRGDDLFIPSGDTVFEPGDKVTAMGTPRGIQKLLFGYLRREERRKEERRATIIGAGEVGLLVARGLEDAGWSVKLIEQDLQRCEEVAPQLRGLVVAGDGADMDLLEEERVGAAPVLVTVTSNDEKNLLISMIARHLGVERIITRADRLANERMFERVGIDVVRSARGAAIRKVVMEIAGGTSAVRAALEHGEMEIVELEIPIDAPERTLAELRAPVFAIVGAVARGPEVIIPRERTVIKPGDLLLVLTSEEHEHATRALFTRGELPEPDQTGR